MHLLDGPNFIHHFTTWRLRRNTMKVRELMTREVETAKAGDDLASAAMVMWRRDCGIVPVVNEDNALLGVLTDRDICIATATRHCRPEELSVGEVMSNRLCVTHSDDDVRSALERMRSERVRRLPVVDGDGHVEGMLSLADIVTRVKASDGQASAKPLIGEVFATFQSICSDGQETMRPQRREEPAVARH
jgi:CBS domain-containing protein